MEKEGSLQEAIAELRAAIRLIPDDADAHNNLGLALADQGKLEQAIAEHRAAIRIEPDLAEAHCNLGVALAKQGKRDEAIAALRKARDHAQSSSKLSQLIEKELNKLDH